VKPVGETRDAHINLIEQSERKRKYRDKDIEAINWILPVRSFQWQDFVKRGNKSMDSTKMQSFQQN
jgi:hypothetical protein